MAVPDQVLSSRQTRSLDPSNPYRGLHVKVQRVLYVRSIDVQTPVGGSAFGTKRIGHLIARIWNERTAGYHKPQFYLFSAASRVNTRGYFYLR